MHEMCEGFKQIKIKKLKNNLKNMATINMKYARDGASKTNIIFDPINGDQTRLNGTKLALDTNGVLLTGEDAFIELEKPIWGPDGDKTFKEILPVLTPQVRRSIPIPDPDYQWHAFDPDDTTTWPTTNPGGGVEVETGQIRAWECESVLDPPEPSKHQYYQNMSYTTCSVWGQLKIFQYRKQRQGSADNVSIPNPEYPIVEAIREAERVEYRQILFDTFKMLGTAIFPILYDNHYQG